MKNMKWLIAIAAIVLVGAYAIHAQSLPVTLFTAPSGSTITNCGTPTLPSVCVVATGVYVWQNSTQGWFMIAPPAAAGVTSWNGQTGAVTYAPAAAPVTSVNGKTGAVVLGATSTTTLQ